MLVPTPLGVVIVITRDVPTGPLVGAKDVIVGHEVQT
jgi:hypothetical protein